MQPPPEPGKPFVISASALNYHLRMAAEEGMIQTDLAINDALYDLIDRVAAARLLTTEDRNEAHRIRKAILASERLRIAQVGY